MKRKYIFLLIEHNNHSYHVVLGDYKIVDIFHSYMVDKLIDLKISFKKGNIGDYCHAKEIKRNNIHTIVIGAIEDIDKFIASL